MPAIISKRSAIELLRRVATEGATPEDCKMLRVFAAQLQKELEVHNQIAKRSRDRQKQYLDGALQWLNVKQ